MKAPAILAGFGLFLCGAISGTCQSSVSLIPTGSNWKYFDRGFEPFDWKDAAFDDTDWAAGPAQLGYGDGDERTVVGFGSDANNKFITTYFRHAFVVEDPEAYASLTVRLLRDDGGVVYLNGIEVFRSNMPGGPLSYFHYAAGTIPNAEESVFFTSSVPVPILQPGTNIMAVEIHQAGPNSSDMSFDLDLVAARAEGPPVINMQPANRVTAPGATVNFAVQATGAPPLRYQWDFNGQLLNDATNAVLRLANVAAEQEGIYRVTVTNALGAVASLKATLTLVLQTGDFFQVYALRTNQAYAVEHANVTGDDRGGVAATFEHLLVTGDEATARFSLSDLSGGVRLTRRHDALVGDLRTGTVYVLGADGAPLDSSGGVVRELLEIDPVTAALTGEKVAFSSPVPMILSSGNLGIFAGFGRIVLHNGSHAFTVRLPSGEVIDHGPVGSYVHHYSESWAHWGVAEHFAGADWMVYVRDSQSIVRTRLPDGYTAPVATFENLSDMASFTVSPLLRRWYFHHEGASQFRTGDETVGFAEAAFAHEQQPQPPLFIRSPPSRTTSEGGAASFDALVLGNPTSYQWHLNGRDLPGATNVTLTINQATASDVGLYTVTAANALGTTTSAAALLNVVVPGQGSVSSVAVLGAEFNADWNEDVREKIEATDLFDRVDAFQVVSPFPLPTLEALREYDALLVYSDNGFSDPQIMGDLLADYVDEGGGLVLATFAFGGGHLAGRIVSGDYMPFTTASQNASSGLRLVPVDPVHPLLDGVESFEGGASSYHNSPLNPTAGSTLVANWSNGEPLVGLKTGSGNPVVGLNFFPPSSDERNDFWDARTDGGRLMANALVAAAGGGSVTVPGVAPGILRQPETLALLQGVDAPLEVRAFGTPPLAYQWFFENDPLTGATNRTLRLDNVQIGQSGSYRVEITNPFGTVTSDAAVLTVQPTRGVVGYYHDHNPSSRAAEASIVRAQFTPLRIGDPGSFDFSRVDAVMLFEPYETVSPAWQSALPALLDFVVAGGNLIVHQTYFNTDSQVNHPLLPGAGQVRFNSYFDTDIDVIPPGNTVVIEGGNGTLDNDSLDGNEFNYAFYAEAATLPPGSTSILSAGSDSNRVLAFTYHLGAGLVYYSSIPLEYYLEYSVSPLGVTMRDVYAPNVLEHAATFPPSGPPVIFGGPDSVGAVLGAQASFFAAVNGRLPLQYQWYRDGALLPGATRNPLRLSGLTEAEAGTYTLEASNVLGTATSPGARLSVWPRRTIAIFADPRYVYPDGAMSSLRAALTDLGHETRLITRLWDAQDADTLVFPDFEINALHSELDDAERDFLRAWVAEGRVMVAAGGYQAVEFLNAVFDLSLTPQGEFFGVSFARTPSASGSPFALGPAFLPANYSTVTLAPGSLPAPALSLYVHDEFGSAATLLPYGAGNLVHLGWNWFDAPPLGGQDDRQWKQVLGAAAQTRGFSTGVPETARTLVPRGSVWRYFDQGRDPGPLWRSPLYPDSAWPSGSAPLGYGNGDEATVVSFGPDPNAKHVTTYFRHAFEFADDDSLTGLRLRLQRDDGAIVYLNGTEVYRSNLPSGTASYNTFALTPINDDEENRFLTASVDLARLRQGLNLLAVEIHQVDATSSDIRFDLALEGLAPAGAPVFTAQPRSQTVAEGAGVALGALAEGAPPLTYQWQFEGADIPEATNAVLVLTALSPSQQGAYRLRTANAFGSALSSSAELTVVSLGDDLFRITALTTNRVEVIDNTFLAGDQRGGIAASSDQLLYTGDDATARFSLVDLSGGTSLGRVEDALVGDLKTGRVYVLADDTASLDANGGIVSALWELNGQDGSPTGVIVALSQSIDLRDTDGRVGLFSGFGWIVIYDGRRAWGIEPSSGQVLLLGDPVIAEHNFNESWAFWGVAEIENGRMSLVYAQNNRIIARTSVSDGLTETVATFGSLGHTASLTVAPLYNRWYFHFGNGSQFSELNQGLAFADASFVSSAPATPPIVLRHPADRTVAVSGAAAFDVIVRGTGPLQYQWLFEGMPLAGATNASLILNRVTPERSGRYAVSARNAAGAVLSDDAVLTVVPLTGDTLRIAALTTNDLHVVSHERLTGGGYAGLAVSGQRAFYCGGADTAHFDLLDLSAGTPMGGYWGAMTVDLASETAYAAAQGTNRVVSSQEAFVTHLLEMDGQTGVWTGRRVTLSQPLALSDRYGHVGWFAGLGRIVVVDGREAWTIEVPSGRVLSLGPMRDLPHQVSSIGFHWGVAEFFEDTLWLVYVRDSRTVVRSRVPDGFTEIVQSFNQLGGMSALTVSLPLNRWYFQHQTPSQFSDFPQTLGFAEAVLDSSAAPAPPTLALLPADRTLAAGGSFAWRTAARGTGPVRYQWFFEDTALPAGTNAVLSLSGVTDDQAGRYWVTVSNAWGMAASSAARLRVIPPVDVAVFDDPNYVFTGGGPFAHSDALQASLAYLGHAPVPFTGIRAIADGEAPVLFPPLEAGDLTSVLTASTREALRGFVERGGVLITHGTASAIERTPRFLNAVFGFNLEASPNPAPPFLRTMGAEETPFREGPATLPAPEVVLGLERSTLPGGTRTHYESGEAIVVAEFPFGGGRVVYLGWNWADAAPAGRFDDGWLTVLGNALIDTAPPAPSAPEILDPPRDRMVVAGTAHEFRVLARGFPLSYQWLHEGTPLPGATNAALRLPAIAPSQAGVYAVIVSTPLGTLTSADAILTVVNPLSVGVYDDPRFVDTSGGPFAESDSLQTTVRLLGHNVQTFTDLAAAAGREVLVFPFFKWDNPLPVFDASSREALRAFVRDGGLLVTHGGYYNLPFLNAVFELSLAEAYEFADRFRRTPQVQGTPLSDAPATVFDNYELFGLDPGTLPASGARNLYGIDGNSAVALVSYGAGHILYLGWTWTDAQPAGGSQDGGWIEVLDRALLIRKGLAPAPPVIYEHPRDQIVRAGLEVTFSAGAFGSPPLRWQWYYEGAALPNETNAVLILRSASPGQAGNYLVVASNDYGTAASASARLDVLPSRGTIGYYHPFSPNPPAVPAAIVQAGFTPWEISDLATFDFSRLDMLLVETSDSQSLSPVLTGRLAAIASWVNAGGRLIIHDWVFALPPGTPHPLLLSSPDTAIVAVQGNDVAFAAPADNLVVAGPHGSLDETSLDGGNPTYHGYAALAGLPAGVLPILTTALSAGEVVAFSYGLGAGSIHYATLPLSRLLDLPGTPGSDWRSVYLPNLLEHAAAFAAAGPPVLLDGPRDVYALSGGPARLQVGVTGQTPLFYQWQFEDEPIPGATAAQLEFTHATAPQSGRYRVTISNELGSVISPEAMLHVIEAQVFRISSLIASGSHVIDHDSVTGDDRGGIAVSGSHVFYSGDLATGRFDAGNLGGGAPLPGIFDALVGNLRTETVYTLAGDNGPISGGGQTLTELLEIDGGTGDLTGRRIALSRPIELGFDTGIFAGYDAVVLHTLERVFRIELPSGLVTDLGFMSPFVHHNCENWAYWGVAEFFSGSVHLVYVQDFQTIARTRVPDGETAPVAAFTYLGDMCSMTVSPSRNRWYFHYEGSAQFGGTAETLGYASASFDRVPRINLTATNLAGLEDTSTGPQTFLLQGLESPQETVGFSHVSSNPDLLPETGLAIGGFSSLRQLTLTPAPDRFGTAVITLTVTDSIGQSSDFVLTWTVLPVNDPPGFEAGPDVVVAEDAGPQEIAGWAANVRAGPENESDQALVMHVATDRPELFAAVPTLDLAGTLRFTPAPDVHGVAVVTVRLEDDGGTENGGVNVSPEYTFLISIQAVNDPPAAFPQTLVGLEDTAVAFNLEGSDADGDPLTYAVVDGPAHGMVSGNGAVWLYVPAVNYFGEDAFTFVAQDGRATSIPAPVRIIIDAVNDPPSFMQGPDRSAAADGTTQTIPQWATQISPGPPNEANQRVTFNLTTDNPALFLMPPNLDGEGTLTFAIAPQGDGQAAVTVIARDDGGTERGGIDVSAPRTFLIRATAMNRPPTALPQTISLDEDTSATLVLHGTDADGDPLTFQVTQAPAYGSLTGAGDTFTYEPAANFFGADQFTFQVRDGHVSSLPAAVSIEIRPVNDPPVAVARVYPLIQILPGEVSAIAVARELGTARILLDGSLSSDVERSPLEFAWFEDDSSFPIATGMRAERSLAVGNHEIVLRVWDGADAGTDRVRFRVVTAAEAVGRLVELVRMSDLGGNARRPFLASLEAAQKSFAKKHFIPGKNQLQAFQNKVRAQLEPDLPSLAGPFIALAQHLIDALDGKLPQLPARPDGGPSSPTPARLRPLPERLNGSFQFILEGDAGCGYILQTSKDLVTWRFWKQVVCTKDTMVLSESAPATGEPRFYRAVVP